MNWVNTSNREFVNIDLLSEIKLIELTFNDEFFSVMIVGIKNDDEEKVLGFCECEDDFNDILDLLLHKSRYKFIQTFRDVCIKKIPHIMKIEQERDEASTSENFHENWKKYGDKIDKECEKVWETMERVEIEVDLY